MNRNKDEDIYKVIENLPHLVEDSVNSYTQNGWKLYGLPMLRNTALGTQVMVQVLIRADYDPT